MIVFIRFFPFRGLDLVRVYPRLKQCFVCTGLIVAYIHAPILTVRGDKSLQIEGDEPSVFAVLQKYHVIITGMEIPRGLVILSWRDHAKIPVYLYLKTSDL